MWVVLKGGHVAAIAVDQVDLKKLAVRCWNEEDARYVLDGMGSWLMGGKPQLVGPTLSDYPWRVVASFDCVSWWLTRELGKIDYEKFKPTVDVGLPGGRARHDALLKMFFAGWDLLRDTPYTKTKRSGRNDLLHRKLAKGVKVYVDSWLDRPTADGAWWTGWTKEEQEWLESR